MKKAIKAFFSVLAFFLIVAAGLAVYGTVTNKFDVAGSIEQLVTGETSDEGSESASGTASSETPTLQQQVTRYATKKAVEAAISSATGTDVSIDELEENMSTEDAEELEGIINKYADNGTVLEAAKEIANNSGNVTEALESLDSVDQEDLEKLYELYEQYGDSLTGTN